MAVGVKIRRSPSSVTADVLHAHSANGRSQTRRLVMVASGRSETRLIKPHRKSRFGCGSCKLHKIKCDEKRPVCEKCKASGYLCKYGGNNSALELFVDDTKVKAFDVISFSLSPSKPLGPGLDRYVFEEHDADLLSRFRSETVLTITTDRSRRVYQDQIIEVAPQVFAGSSLLLHQS